MGEKERGHLESNLTFLLKAVHLFIKWLAMQRWNVLFSHWIKSLPTWQLPQIPLTSLTVFFSLSHYSLPLVLLKITCNMTEILVSFQRAHRLRFIQTVGKSFTGVNVLICSKTVITIWHEQGLSVCVRLVSVCCQCSHKELFSL